MGSTAPLVPGCFTPRSICYSKKHAKKLDPKGTSWPGWPVGIHGFPIRDSGLSGFRDSGPIRDSGLVPNGPESRMVF